MYIYKTIFKHFDSTQKCKNSKIINKYLIISLFAAPILHSCNNSEITTNNDEMLLRIEANIEATKVSTRYSATDINSIQFSDGDEIGIFINEKDLSKWIYSDSWNSETKIYWSDKETVYNFHAFYPYNNTSTYETITTPSLSIQDGTLQSLGAHDFMTTNISSDYSNNNGNVSFTGQNSFKHIYSLICLNINNIDSEVNSKINSVTLSGTNIATASSYSFEDSNLSSNSHAPEVNIINIESEASLAEKKSFYIIVNPFSDNIDLTINYTIGSYTYNATKASLIISPLSGGSKYSYNITLKDNAIKITDSAISEWAEGNDIEDITI